MVVGLSPTLGAALPVTLQMLQALGARIGGPQPAEFNGIKDLEVSSSLDGLPSSTCFTVRWLSLVLQQIAPFFFRGCHPMQPNPSIPPTHRLPCHVPLQLWPRVAWSPLWACSWDDVEAKVRQTTPVCDSLWGFPRASQTLPAAFMQR